MGRCPVRSGVGGLQGQLGTPHLTPRRGSSKHLTPRGRSWACSCPGVLGEGHPLTQPWSLPMGICPTGHPGWEATWPWRGGAEGASWITVHASNVDSRDSAVSDGSKDMPPVSPGPSHSLCMFVDSLIGWGAGGWWKEEGKSAGGWGARILSSEGLNGAGWTGCSCADGGGGP